MPLPLFAQGGGGLRHCYADRYYLSATAAQPEGPFAIRNRNVTMLEAHGLYCDFALHVDSEAEAYLLYTVWYPVGAPLQRTHLRVERLTPDFLASAHVASQVFGGVAAAAEAPALLQRNGTYYALFGHGCCFCAEGSGVTVLTAPHALGPYSEGEAYDVGCVPGEPAATCASVVRAQQNAVFAVRTTTGEQHVWTGDRWQSAADRLKSHDLQFWAPLQWDDSAVPSRLQRLRWRDSFRLDLA